MSVAQGAGASETGSGLFTYDHEHGAKHDYNREASRTREIYVSAKMLAIKQKCGNVFAGTSRRGSTHVVFTN